MDEAIPEYLRAFGPIDKPLKGFDETDLPGHKPKREPVDAQMARVIRPMPDSQMAPLGGPGPEVEWLLAGEPRAVQVEALRRSYYGYWQHQGEDDANGTPRRVVDARGLGRTGPARGWGHFLEQRLGKTPVFLNEFGLLARDYDCKWGVVIAPNKFKPEWPDEADRFRLGRPTHLFDSRNRAAAQRWIDNNRRGGGLIAVNYEALLSDDTLSLLEGISAGSLIGFDESVSAKNYQGDLAKACLRLAKCFRWRRDLTGKPVVQGPHDLFMQLRLIGELNGVDPLAFRNRFCKMGGFKGKKVTGSRNEEELGELLASCSFLARRANWLKTPGRDYAVQHIDMLPEQKAHYHRMEQDFITELERDGFDPLVVSADQIVTKLLKLQQIASGFIIDEWGKAHDIVPRSANPKLQHVKNMLRNEIDHKVIVFAHHQHSIEMLKDELAEFNPAFIVGDVQSQRFGVDVQAEKRRFNGDRTCRVVIGQEQAIKYGHTLMGNPDDPCLSEIFYENNYSLNDRSQCEERPQGAGQVGAITIYDLIAAPIDMNIVAALQDKEDVSAAVLNYARETGVLPRGM
jgi:hypothetical protein